MPNMICQRNYILRTTTGHMIRFEAGVPKYVPPECVDHALAVNIIMEGGGYATRSEAAVTGPVRVAAMSNELREALLLHSLDELVRDGDSSTFDAGGKPKTQSIKEHANLELNAVERNRLWDKYRDIKSTNSDLPRPRNFELVLDVQQCSTSKQLADQLASFGISPESVRGFTLKELKSTLVQAAINYDATVRTTAPKAGAPAFAEDGLPPDVDLEDDAS